MSLADYFQLNVELWARRDPKEAILLPYLKQENVQFCQTLIGEENLSLSTESGMEYFHAPAGAVAEAKAWFSCLNLNGVDVLYVYGIGLGYYYDAIKPWLSENPGRAVVFLEDDLRPIAAFFKTERAHRLLQDSQVHLIYIKDPAAKKDVLGDVYWNFAMTKAQVSALKYYQEKKESFFQEVCHEISYSSDLKKALLDEYLNFGAHYFVNFYRNLLQLPKSYLGDHLFGKFRGVPAVICGAGPSLEKNGALLSQLRQRALIFAGGSSINILNGLGIQPHFCVGIDPNDAQQVRLRSNQAFEVPFFYRQRLNHGAFRTVHGPHLYVTGSGGYDVAEFFEERLDIKGTFFEEGHNVINFAMEIAHQMGCYPLIFVGMDLAFTDRKTYSAGVTFDPAVEQRSLTEYANFETTGMLRKDIYGEPIYTLWKWVAEAEWIGDWAKKNSDARLLNCTEGGLGFPGVPNRALAEVCQEFLRDSSALQGRIHAEVQNSRMPQVTQERVELLMHELHESLRRCGADLDVLIEELDKLKEKSQLQEKALEHAQSGKAALAELELEEEPAYGAILAIFNTVSSHLINKEVMQIKYDQRLEEWQKNISRMELTQKKLRFLRETAKANAELIDFAFAEQSNDNLVSTECQSESMKVSPPLRDRECLPIPAGDVGKEGPWRTYYDSGSVKGISHYKEGVLHGPALFYSESGALLSQEFFSEGELEGEALYFYPSEPPSAPQLFSRQHFLQGIPHGKQLYYYENGQLKTSLEYLNGQLIGEGLLYAPNGSLKRKILFSN